MDARNGSGLDTPAALSRPEPDRLLGGSPDLVLAELPPLPQEKTASRERESVARRRLANRRAAIAFDVEHQGQRFRCHAGFYKDGNIGEVFLDAAKQNSTIDAFGADAAILISLLLQHGAGLAEIGHALRRGPNGAPASLIGAVVDALDMIEVQP